MEDHERRRLSDAAERMIGLIDAGDDLRFETLWNSLTARERRIITVSVMSMLAQSRRERSAARDETRKHLRLVARRRRA
jgi:hypothetical protein